ncbi:MAG: DUF47 domain-containing protein [Bacteroidales bacterium]
MVLFKHANESIVLIDSFLDSIEQGGLLFKEGVKNYLNNNRELFLDNLKTLSKLETDADCNRRKVENILYTQSLMPQLRGDILRLLEVLDDIIDIAKESLYQFDVEIPKIPTVLNADLIKLTEVSCSAIDAVVPAARAYFRNPEAVKEMIHRVYLFEKEADRLADAIKRKVFQELQIEKLSEKFHLRYFTLHIESISDAAEDAADMLSIMAIKRTI